MVLYAFSACQIVQADVSGWLRYRIIMDFPLLGDFVGLLRGPLLQAYMVYSGWPKRTIHSPEHFYTLLAEVTLILQVALLYGAQ